MKLNYRKYRNTNRMSSAFGKWYARAVTGETVGLEQLAAKMQENCTVKRADILAVLSELGTTINGLVQDSKRVLIPYLGAFKLGISCKGELKPEDVTAKSVKNIHVIFQPETYTTSDGRRLKQMTADVQLAELPDYDRPKSEDDDEPGNGENNG